MTNMTFAVPDAMHRQMRKHKEIQWSTIVRNAIEAKLERLEEMRSVEKMLEGTDMTKEELDFVVALGREINKGMAARTRQEMTDLRKRGVSSSSTRPS